MASLGPQSPMNVEISDRWQRTLEAYCKNHNLRPEWNIVSDRRGGRTAWSATVVILGLPPKPEAFCARFWYDGNYLTNAKEDAAEVALGCLSSLPSNQKT
ncbi:hypothetical protein TWF730_002235 [Orbilia blumenaviensis]|uniref:DRBM domain-containing protein n=1 Tax=Orbilia blumenaviensis TaxID=1796055 RepID=A0AAV9UH28_9PEZI